MLPYVVVANLVPLVLSSGPERSQRKDPRLVSISFLILSNVGIR